MLAALERHNRVLAAPHVLRPAITKLARSQGIEVTELSLPHDRCVHCGGRLALANRVALWWLCPQCGRTFIQDEAYCRLMLCERVNAAEHGDTARTTADNIKTTTYGRTRGTAA